MFEIESGSVSALLYMTYLESQLTIICKQTTINYHS